MRLAAVRPRASLALRIALASALFGLALAAAAVALGYWALSRQLDERAAAELQGRRELLEHIVRTLPALDAVAGSRHRFGDLFFGHDDLHLALADPASGRTVLGFSDTAVRALTILNHASAAPDVMHSWVTPDGLRFSGMHGLAPMANGRPLRFYLSVDRRSDASLLSGFTNATLVALPLMLLAVAVGAGLIARTGLAPLRGFNRLAASIDARTLNHRLPDGHMPRELADMAREFNGMLDRIDDGYHRLEDFSGDLAHEMRTPVATLLGRTQVVLSQPRSAAELRDVLEGNVDELERLAALIEDMLFIARAEHDAAVLQTQAVDLAGEAETVAEYLSLGAEESGVRIAVSGTAPTIDADRLMIQRAITNLVSNAIRHAWPGSTVTVELGSAPTAATLAVGNKGEAIPPASLERIFDRFYRADPARSRREGGSGLGLAIVQSIAAAHRGTVTVVSEPGQTRFTLTLPRAAGA